MDKNEARWIVGMYHQYRDLVLAELARHPGMALDDMDIMMVDTFMSRLRENGRNGHRIAHYEDGFEVGKTKPIWINGALNLILWIRDRKFRPKIHEVVEEAERLEMIQTAVQLTGETAAQRAIVTRPKEITNGPRMFGMPVAPMPDEVPSWLSRFPTTGSEDGDKVLMNCLLHLSEGKAHATIDSINRDNEIRTKARSENDEDKRQKAKIRLERLDSSNAASKMYALWKQGI